jgi:hypothetical protein
MSDGREKTLIEQLENELGVHAGTALAEEVRLYITRLGETGDLNWIDLMVVRLTEEGVPLPTTIQVLAARAAYRRLHGVGSRNRKSKVITEHARSVALAQTAFFRGATGASIEKATAQAANAVGAALGYAGKASVLNAVFPKYVREGPHVDLLATVGRTWAELYPEQKAELESELAALHPRPRGRRR